MLAAYGKPDALFPKRRLNSRCRIQSEGGASRKCDGIHRFDRVVWFQEVGLPGAGSAAEHLYGSACRLIAYDDGYA